jgi:hypothetical protein
MSNSQIHSKLLLVAGTLSALISWSTPPRAAETDSQDTERRGRIERVIHGTAVTGHNDVVGRPFYDWGPPFGTFGFATLGAYNPQGPEPIRLQPDTPLSTLVATMIDPNLLASTGVDPSAVDPSWVNVPLRDVPVQYSFGETEQFPGIFAADDVAVKAQAVPVNPITLGQWMRAGGTATIKCKRNNEASVKLQMHDLIPNRMYAVWSTLGTSRSGTGPVFPSIPVGGVPNIFVTDRQGDAVYERVMQFCPLRPETTDRPMLVINVQLHSNHQNYGGINGPPLASVPGGYWIGSVIHNHVQFPVNVTLLN